MMQEPSLYLVERGIGAMSKCYERLKEFGFVVKAKEIVNTKNSFCSDRESQGRFVAENCLIEIGPACTISVPGMNIE